MKKHKHDWKPFKFSCKVMTIEGWVCSICKKEIPEVYESRGIFGRTVKVVG